MHELSIARSIAEAVEQQCAQRPGAVVDAVRVRIGRLSGVAAESLQFCWELAVQDTRLAGARLEIEVTEPHCRCRRCGAEAAFPDPPEQCPQCGADEWTVEGGADLTLASMELREEEDP